MGCVRPAGGGDEGFASLHPLFDDRSCVTLLSDGFESGTLAAWSGTRGSPAVVGAGAIAGARSLSTRLGTDNAAVFRLSGRRRLRFQFRIDVGGATTSGTHPRLAGLEAVAAGYNPVAIYIGHENGTPLMSVRAYHSDGQFERSGFADLPARRSLVGIGWEAATATAPGTVTVLVDGIERWTTSTLTDPAALIDEVVVGNTGASGSGTMLIDDVLVEDCTAPRPGPEPSDMAPPPPPDTAAPPADAAPPDVPGPPPRDAAPSPEDVAPPPPPPDAVTPVVGPVDLQVGCGCAVGARSGRGRSLAPVFLLVLLVGWRRSR